MHAGPIIWALTYFGLWPSMDSSKCLYSAHELLHAFRKLGFSRKLSKAHRICRRGYKNILYYTLDSLDWGLNLSEQQWNYMDKQLQKSGLFDAGWHGVSLTCPEIFVSPYENYPEIHGCRFPDGY